MEPMELRFLHSLNPGGAMGTERQAEEKTERRSVCVDDNYVEVARGARFPYV